MNKNAFVCFLTGKLNVRALLDDPHTVL